MFKPVESWALVCDRCASHFEHGDFTIFCDRDMTLDDARESDWWVGDPELSRELSGPHYCPHCHRGEYSEDDDSYALVVFPLPSPHPVQRNPKYSWAQSRGETCQATDCGLRADHAVHAR